MIHYIIIAGVIEQRVINVDRCFQIYGDLI